LSDLKKNGDVTFCFLAFRFPIGCRVAVRLTGYFILKIQLPECVEKQGFCFTQKRESTRKIFLSGKMNTLY